MTVLTETSTQELTTVFPGRRRELTRGRMPWVRTLEPLAGISTTLGLLGSVVGFLIAFATSFGLDALVKSPK